MEKLANITQDNSKNILSNENIDSKIPIPESLSKEKWSKMTKTEDNIFTQDGEFNVGHVYYKQIKKMFCLN